MNELALFAGAGGGILGGHLLGWRTVCAVEWDPYAASVLVARQNDGSLPPFPIWDDVQTFDGRPWRGRVDVVSGGFPCQDISSAGKGAGITGERSGMWTHMARIVGEARPRYVFVENSPLLVRRGLDVVLGDLATLGYDARWGIVGAHHAGAPHKRDRIWIVGYALRTGCEADNRRQSLPDENWHSQAHAAGWEEQQQGITSTGAMANATSIGQQRSHESQPDNGGQAKGWAGQFAGSGSGSAEDVANANGKRRQDRNATAVTDQSRQCDGPVAEGWWHTDPAERSDQPDVGRVAHGVASRVDRLKCIGNGQVPAWQLSHGVFSKEIK